MRLAITGSSGQLGSTLLRATRHDTVLPIDLPDHDITKLDAMVRIVREFRPQIIVHAAAMTDVDGCERDPDSAYRINVIGTRNMAVAALEAGAALVYISTDYVFDGEKPEPYWEYDMPHPLSVYGRTKWVGERTVRDILSRFYIMRIAWLYGPSRRNFVETVLGLAEQRDSFSMVTDEVGSPTNSVDAADAILRLVRQPAYGIYHLPNAGVCSRYEWARAILRLADRSDVEVVGSQDYQRPARVPKRVELKNLLGAQLGIVMRHWEEALAAHMAGRTKASKKE